MDRVRIKNSTLIKPKTLSKIFIIGGVLAVLAGPVYRYRAEQSHEPVALAVETGTGIVAPDHGPIQRDTSFANLLPDEKLLPKKIIIPSVDIELSINPAKVIQGKWEVFDDRASFGLGSAVPGAVGNSVIFAHARRGQFLSLREIDREAKVYILGSDKWYEYEVTEIKEVAPSDVSVIKPTEEEILTLYTCSGFADSKRIIVIAKRVAP